MAVTVVDSKGELDAFIAEQDGAPAKPAAEEKPIEAAKEAEKPAAKDGEDPDDIEGEDGLTQREKNELSEKMLKAVGKRVRRQREAEEFATAQFNEKLLAERRASLLEEELQRLKAQQQPPKQDQGPQEPDRSKYTTDSDYFSAMVEYRVQVEMRKMQQEEARRAAERRQQEIVDTARTRIQKATELVDDFEAVTKAADLSVPPVVASYMQKSEMFAELGYYLAKNPEQLTKLQKLAPDEQLVQIGKIEGKLTPFGSKNPDATPSDGATPSSKAVAKDGKQSQPSDETGYPPSKARVTAPVITPLNSSLGSAVEKEPREQNIRETINSWQKSNKVNLGLRKRH
jgi:hypothetical protein